MDGNRTSDESAAVDSSLSLKFSRRKDAEGSIETSHEGVLVDCSTTRDLAIAVHKAAEREDLEKALAEFEDFLVGRGFTGCWP